MSLSRTVLQRANDALKNIVTNVEKLHVALHVALQVVLQVVLQVGLHAPLQVECAGRQ